LDHHFEFIEDNPDLEFEEVIDCLMECLEQLTPNYRSPLQHYYWDDLPVKEIAAKVGVALETCKKRLQRGRKMLRDCMKIKGMLAPAEGDGT
jgi:RNA polymerase sigma factor (sigma-70 family)